MEPIKKPHGFSLVEILAVVAILSILVILAVPAAQTLVHGYRLNSSGNQLAALIERARMHATTTQRIGVLRLYADPESKDISQGFRILQLLEFVPDASNETTPITMSALTRAYVLEAPIIISPENSSAFSNTSMQSATGTILGTDGVPCREIYFFPNGSTSLEATPINPYFTLMASHDDAGNPANPFVVSLDPVTARVTRFQR